MIFGPFTQYVHPHKKRIIAGLLAIAAGQAATSWIPLLVGAAVNSIDLDAASRDEVLGGIYLFVAQILGLAVVVAATNHIMRLLLGGAATRIEYDIRAAYFAHLLTLPLSYYQRHRTGDLMARATNDLTAVRIFFMYGLRGLAEMSLIFVFSIAFMCFIDWKLALMVLLPLPVFGLVIVRMASLVHNRFRAIQEFFGQLSNFIQENLAGIRIVKAYAQGGAQTAAFERLNQSYLEKNSRLVHTHAIYYPLTYLVASVALGLNLWFGGGAVIAGQLSIGDFVAFNGYLTLLIRPIAYMGWAIDRLQRARVAIRRIDEVMEVRPEISDRRVRPPRRQVAGHLQFRNLSFSYGDTPVLRGIDLEIPAGATLGIVGRVGSGKTTLARLIPRLIEAGRGQLLIDGTPVEDWPLEQLRQAIGYVSQMPFLFSNTIKANLAYGVEKPRPEEIAAAAEQAQLTKDVETFEHGFDTLIGERGVTLSGGQKQRSTLARALIRRPRILILDDALAAVDTQTEEAILGHLRQAVKGCTAIIIAHRISTLRAADRIVVLDSGRIVEQGNHQDLVRRGGFYADLFQRQQLAAELEAL